MVAGAAAEFDRGGCMAAARAWTGAAGGAAARVPSEAGVAGLAGSSARSGVIGDAGGTETARASGAPGPVPLTCRAGLSSTEAASPEIQAGGAGRARGSADSPGGSPAGPAAAGRPAMGSVSTRP